MRGLADRVVLQAFLPRFLATLGAALALYSVVELVDLANLASAPPLQWYPLRLPFAFVLVSPLTLLAGGCWATVFLIRSGQITALAAAGRGPRRVLGALVLAGLIWGGLVWLTAHELAPRGLARWSSNAGHDSAPPQWGNGGAWLVRLAQDGGPLLAFELGPDGQPVRTVEARRAQRQPSGRAWTLRDGSETLLGLQPRPFAVLELDLGPFVPSAGADPSTLVRAALARAIHRAQQARQDAAPLQAEDALRTALAVACPVCLLLGALCGAHWGRRPSWAWSAAAGAGLTYWLLLTPCWVGVAAGNLPPWIATWGPAGALGAIVLWGWSRL